MAADATPTRRGKRAQQDQDDGEPSLLSSAKRRRLNGVTASSPSTPKALNAINSALSGALGRGTRSLGRGKHSQSNNRGRISASDPFEVVESDQEAQEARAEGSGRGKRTTTKLSRPAASTAIYDVPDSGDELASPAATTTRSAKKLASWSKSAAKQSLSKSTTTSRSEDVTEEDVDPSLDDGGTPSKTRSQRVPKAAGPRDQVDPSNDEEESEVPTPSARRFGGRRGAAASLADSGPVSNGTPKLKGILTPSRRKGGRGRKSVAFDSTGHGGGQDEVFFEDLPTKASKTPVAKSSSARQDGPESAIGAIEEVDGEASEEEAPSEEDVACVICSKPNSKPPNEIVLCDGCDRGYHQKCHNLRVIPKGTWFCRECSDPESATGDGVKTAPAKSAAATTAAAAITRTASPRDHVPDIPNFDEHLQALQRVLVDRCTGKRRIRLRGQEEAYEKTFQLVEQTVLAGEGNSMLIIGARGSGKTTLIESVISDLSASHKDEFHVVRLNGFIHTDDKIALKEIWRQLGKEMEVEDGLVKKTHNYADTLASLLAVLSHPSEISGTDGEAGAGTTTGVASKSVVFVMDEFDLFATHARQTLLYNLFDVAQARKAPVAVVGLTCRVDVVEGLEKRVKSRFSHRHVHLSLPRSVSAYWDVCRQGLVVDEVDLQTEGLEAASPQKGQKKFYEWWNKQIETLRQEPAFCDHLESLFYSSKSVSTFLISCTLPLSAISPSAPQIDLPSPSPTSSLEAPDSKLHLLESLSDLELALLISAARLDIVAHTDTVNFAMAYDEYTSLIGRQRVQSATSGVLALGGAARAWGRGVAGTAWERLVSVGLLMPAAGTGLGRGGGGAAAAASAAAGNMGLEAKMWKMDVALEEIPLSSGLKPTSLLARWCREI